jgi:hypothetical protein
MSKGVNTLQRNQPTAGMGMGQQPQTAGTQPSDWSQSFGMPQNQMPMPSGQMGGVHPGVRPTSLLQSIPAFAQKGQGYHLARMMRRQNQMQNRMGDGNMIRNLLLDQQPYPIAQNGMQQPLESGV